MVGEIIQGYREHTAAEAGIVPVPARVLGSDIEAAAADLRRKQQAVWASCWPPSRVDRTAFLDAAAVFRSLAQAAESVAASAVSWAARNGRSCLGG